MTPMPGELLSCLFWGVGGGSISLGDVDSDGFALEGGPLVIESLEVVVSGGFAFTRGALSVGLYFLVVEVFGVFRSELVEPRRVVDDYGAV